MVSTMTERFVAGIERFAETEGIDLVTFDNGQRKDDFAKENTDYIGDPVVSGEDVLSNTPSPDEESGVGDYLAEDDDSAGMKEDPLQGRPAAT
jgi:hypothetical protein